MVDDLEVLDIYDFHCGREQSLYRPPSEGEQPDFRQMPGMAPRTSCEDFTPLNSYGSLRQLRDAGLDDDGRFTGGAARRRHAAAARASPEDLTVQMNALGSTVDGYEASACAASPRGVPRVLGRCATSRASCATRARDAFNILRVLGVDVVVASVIAPKTSWASARR